MTDTTACTPRQGLPSDEVNEILEDAQGRLWLSSDHGICSISKRQLDRVAAGASAEVEPSAIVELLRGLAPFDHRADQFVALGRIRDWEAWQRAASDALARAGLSGRFRAIAAPDPLELVRLLGDDARGVIVVLADPSARDALLDAATIPLLLLPPPVRE